MFSLCPCRFPPGFLVSTHLQNHAGRYIGYIKLSLGVNKCANVYAGSHPGGVLAMLTAFPCCTPNPLRP